MAQADKVLYMQSAYNHIIQYKAQADLPLLILQFAIKVILKTVHLPQF